MKTYLIQFGDTYLNNLDICGFCIMSETQKDVYFNLAEKLFKDHGNVYQYFLSRDKYIRYVDYSHFKDRFSFEEISSDVKGKIEFHFGLITLDPKTDDIVSDDKLLIDHHTYGFFPREPFKYFV